MALDKSKTDAKLGKEINKFLIKHKVETPLLAIGDVGHENKLKYISQRVEEIMCCLGLDISDDSLCETPKRVAKMYLNETLWGLDYNNFPRVMDVDNKINHSAMVLVRGINVTSVCEHHWQNIIGSAHVAYLPKGRIIGLSKLNRVVEFFSRRPQVQERLVEQIYFALSHILKTEDIAVTIMAKHFCTMSRGVEDHNSDTVTPKLGGLFMSDLSVKEEYYNAIKL